MAKQKIKIMSANLRRTGRGGKAPTKIAMTRRRGKGAKRKA